MTKKLIYIDGFAQSDFIEYVIVKYGIIDQYAIDMLNQVCDYGRKHKTVSKDSFAFFISDLIPGIDLKEACAFFEDECLTREGQLLKQEFWRDHE